MAMKDKVEQIRAILAKTAESGATESEAMASMQLAQRLMKKYGLTMDDINSHEIDVDDYKWVAYNRPSNNANVFENLILNAIAKFTNCKGLFQVTEGKGKYRKRTPIFYGHIVDASLAAFIFNRCVAALKYEWSLFHAKTQIHGNKKKAFSIGMAERIIERMEELMEDDRLYSGSTDLIVLKNAIVEKLFEAETENTNFIKSNPIIPYDDSADTYKYGYEAGDKVELHRNVGNKKVLKIEDKTEK